MLTQTFILDEQDFGHVQKAYDSYPLAVKELENKLNVYQKSLHKISGENLSKIKMEDMKKIDALAEQTEMCQTKCASLKAELFQNFAQMASEIQTIEKDLLNKSENLPQGFDINLAKSLFSEAHVLKSENKVCKALDKIYAAHEYFNTAYADIRTQWVSAHQNRIQTIMDEFTF